MTISEQVHWHEGLFLQPHHLQTMQQQVQQQFTEERLLGWAYPYGVIEARLSADQLENMVVGFDKLRLVLPSGVMIDVPTNADLPTIDIKHALMSSSGSLVISIGVPRWSAGRGNTIEGDQDWRDKRMFRVKKVDRADENTGQNLQPLMVRRINARLLLESDDQSEMETMPLLRIKVDTSAKVSLPAQDPSFVPPCMVLSGSPLLRDTVRDLANQVEASRVDQRAKLTRAGFTPETLKSIQFTQLLRLRTLSRFGARLINLWQAPGVTPFQIYIELRELLGELAALIPTTDLYDVVKYDHDNPWLAFDELNRKIRPLLKPEGEESVLRLDFKRDARVLAVVLTDMHLTKPSDYFLGIKSKLGRGELARLVEDENQFKLMPDKLTGRAVHGIRLVEENNPPQVLPSQFHYFRLAREDSKMRWEDVKAQKKMTLEWPNLDASDFKESVSLFMTVMDVGANK